MLDENEPLDAGISEYVRILREGGVETYESCEGGEGHPYAEPTVRFYGGRDEGFRALAWALQHGLPVEAIRRFWEMLDGEPTGPEWEMVFSKTTSPRDSDGVKGGDA